MGFYDYCLGNPQLSRESILQHSLHASTPWNSPDAVQAYSAGRAQDPALPKGSNGPQPGAYAMSGEDEQQVEICLHCVHKRTARFDPCEHCDGAGNVRYAANYVESMDQAGTVLELVRCHAEYPVSQCVSLGLTKVQFLRLRWLFCYA